MAVAKKAAAKRVATKPRVKATKVFYAVIRRGLLNDRIVGLFSTEPLARAEEARLESTGSWSFNVYTVQRAELIG